MSNSRQGDRLVSADVVEQVLPGIGHRFECRTMDGDDIVVVIHHSGRRDVSIVNHGADAPVASVALTDTQARTLSAVLGGVYFKPAFVDDVQAVIGGLLIEWVTLRDDSPGASHMIAELEIRQHTRMAIAAIVREDGPIVAPIPNEVLLPGDRLIVLGHPDDIRAFVTHVLG